MWNHGDHYDNDVSEAGAAKAARVGKVLIALKLAGIAALLIYALPSLTT